MGSFSNAPSRSTSYETGLNNLRNGGGEGAAPGHEFGSLAATALKPAEKPAQLDNPLAQLLQIRSEIRSAPNLPGMVRSFPVLAQSAPRAPSPLGLDGAAAPAPAS